MELETAMKRTVLILLMAATAVAVTSQTPAKPTTTAAKPATATAHSTASSSAIKLPPGVPPASGVVKTAFSLRYQDITVGAGAVAEPNKLYKFHFTLWLAADGRKLESSYDHRAVVKDKDGKPVLDADGKPKLGDPQVAAMIQGTGRPFPGWDQGFEGMKVGGKRRIFIPWQLGLGAQERPTMDAAHPAIPGKSDLILDIELKDMTDNPMPANRPGVRPGMPPAAGMPAPRPGVPGGSGGPGASGGAVPMNRPPTSPMAPGAPAAPAAPSTPASPVTPAAPSAPAAVVQPAAPAPPTAPAQPATPAAPAPPSDK